MFLSIGMLKLNYFLADIFILSAEKQPIKLSWRKIECLHPFPIEKILVAENHVPTTNNESLFILKFHNILRISR